MYDIIYIYTKNIRSKRIEKQEFSQETHSIVYIHIRLNLTSYVLLLLLAYYFYNTLYTLSHNRRQIALILLRLSGRSCLKPRDFVLLLLLSFFLNRYIIANHVLILYIFEICNRPSLISLHVVSHAIYLYYERFNAQYRKSYCLMAGSSLQRMSVLRNNRAMRVKNVYPYKY